MSLKKKLRKFHAKMAPGGYADHQEKKDAASKASVQQQLEQLGLNRRNAIIGRKAPAGFDPSIFQLSARPGEEVSGADKGAAIRKNALYAADPLLRRATKKRDIFAYNDAISNLRTMISRTTGGPKLAKEMPDPTEVRRQARLKRRPMGSRAQNLGLSF